MFDKRLFSTAGNSIWFVVAKVAFLWCGLISNVLFVLAAVGLLRGPLTLGPVGLGGAREFAALIVTAVVLRIVSAMGGSWAGFRAARDVKVNLRARIYRKMLSLGPSYAGTVRTADVVQTAGEGVEQVETFFSLFLPQLFYSILAPLTLFVVLLPVNVPAAVTLLVFAPLIVLIVGMVAMSAARMFKKYWGKYTDMGTVFLDNVEGLETLKSYDADEAAHRTMNEKAEQFRIATMKVLQIQLRSLTAMDAVAYGGAAAGIGVAVWQVAAGRLDLAGALAVVLLSADFFVPLRQLGSYFHVAMNGMTSSKRIFALLDLPEPKYGSKELPAGVAPRIDVRNVSYTYEDGTQALDGLDFAAEAHGFTAIVGRSGSGKSTVANLLAGRLQGYEGSITWADGSDGGANPIELRDATAASLMRAVTVVGSTSHLFHASLRTNLLMARPDAGDDELWHALEQARIADFVRAHKDGLDLMIEPGAANLSGGQRQRIAIARALLHDASLYVFDEATSSVDVDSETLILHTVRELAERKTVLFITHRMANAEHADHVVVMEHGRAVEAGTPGQLMAADGTYARMIRAQRAVEDLDDVDDDVDAVRSDRDERSTKEAQR